jgi:hypothetical protein
MTISPSPLRKKEAPSLCPLEFQLFAPYLSLSSASRSEISSARSLNAKVCFYYFIVPGCYATVFGGANALTKCAYKRFFRRYNLPSLSIRFCITSTAISCRLSPVCRHENSPSQHDDVKSCTAVKTLHKIDEQEIERFLHKTFRLGTVVN